MCPTDSANMPQDPSPQAYHEYGPDRTPRPSDNPQRAPTPNQLPRTVHSPPNAPQHSSNALSSTRNGAGNDGSDREATNEENEQTGKWSVKNGDTTMRVVKEFQASHLVFDTPRIHLNWVQRGSSSTNGAQVL